MKVFPEKKSVGQAIKEYNESKRVDELKVYTGKETLQALLEGKTLKDKHQYKIENNTILYKEDGYEWTPSKLTLQVFLKKEFTEVVTPQVGDWVKVNSLNKFTIVGQITKVIPDRMYGYWGGSDTEAYYLNSDIVSWEILTPEQVSEYKREQAFVKVGRKPNEYKCGDIVYIDSVYRVAIVASNNNTSVINLHGINEEGKGYTAKPHQLTPISFVEDQVSLD